MNTILATAKAWAALIGSVLTALVATLTPDSPAYQWLTYALAVVTALATYAVPNKPSVVVGQNVDRDMHVAKPAPEKEN